MVRAAFVFGMIWLVPPSPALAMPNAFWIFGFHVPGKHGPKSDVVMTGPKDRRVASLRTLADITAPTTTGRPSSSPQ